MEEVVEIMRKVIEAPSPAVAAVLPPAARFQPARLAFRDLVLNVGVAPIRETAADERQSRTATRTATTTSPQ
jgi:hypothetical protein